MGHFVHYHRRRITSSRGGNWYERPQADGDGFDAPRFHTTRDTTAPATEIGPGDTIWLFSQLKSPWGNLPVALDGKFCVTARRDLRAQAGATKAAFHYEVGPGSAWFPLFDAAPTLAQLRTRTARGTVAPLLSAPDQHPGIALQRLRRVDDPAPLRALEARLTSLRQHFVSYRMRDGTRPAHRWAAHLMAQGHAVWWDRWSLPRRLVERRETVSGQALNDTIFGMIAERAEAVWGIETALYQDPDCYGAQERAFAQRRGLYRRAPM